jgi:hypothetical protein
MKILSTAIMIATLAPATTMACVMQAKIIKIALMTVLPAQVQPIHMDILEVAAGAMYSSQQPKCAILVNAMRPPLTIKMIKMNSILNVIPLMLCGIWPILTILWE